MSFSFGTVNQILNTLLVLVLFLMWVTPPNMYIHPPYKNQQIPNENTYTNTPLHNFRWLLSFLTVVMLVEWKYNGTGIFTGRQVHCMVGMWSFHKSMKIFLESYPPQIYTSVQALISSNRFFIKLHDLTFNLSYGAGFIWISESYHLPSAQILDISLHMGNAGCYSYHLNWPLFWSFATRGILNWMSVPFSIHTLPEPFHLQECRYYHHQKQLRGGIWNIR